MNVSTSSDALGHSRFRYFQMLCAAAALLLTHGAASSQTMLIHRVDASDFPVLRASFYAFDAAGQQIVDLSPEEVHVMEDGIPRSVTRLTSPPLSPPVALSAVLAIQAFTSIPASVLSAYKDAATWWVSSVPSPETETAVITYSDTTRLEHAFSKDAASLTSAIAAISAPSINRFNHAVALGGTPASGIELCVARSNKRTIVLFTSSSRGGIDDCDLPVLAREEDIAIHSIVLGEPAHESVQRACENTGGLWFAHCVPGPGIVEVLRKILLSTSAAAPCEVEWVSDGCKQLDRILDVTLPAVGLHAQTTFEVPAKYLPELEVAPAITLQFRGIPPGSMAIQSLTITARRRPVHVDEITLSNPAFRVVDYGGSPPPFSLVENESRELAVEFAPSDSTYQVCRIEFSTDACFGKSFYVDGDPLQPQVSGALTVRRPNGGERLIAGAIERLTWEGAEAEDTIRLEYSVDGGSSWKLVTSAATGLYHDWMVPSTPSDSCLLRASRLNVPAYDADMVFIPPGTFLMGNYTNHPDYSKWSTYNSGDGYDTEKPVHEVSITRPMFMGRTEVTQALYESVMGTNPSRPVGADYPVGGVGWYDAAVFCNRLSVLRGFDTCYSGEGKDMVCNFSANGFRLPTEAEWEYACRAGTRTDFYSGNLPLCDRYSHIPHLDSAAWYFANTDPFNTNPYPRPVAQKKPNAFGLYDMHGNAYEYCWDCEDWYYYQSSPSLDPQGPQCRSLSNYTRVVRSGSSSLVPRECRSSTRFWHFADGTTRSASNGFRIVRNP